MLWLALVLLVAQGGVATPMGAPEDFTVTETVLEPPTLEEGVWKASLEDDMEAPNLVGLLQRARMRYVVARGARDETSHEDGPRRGLARLPAWRRAARFRRPTRLRSNTPSTSELGKAQVSDHRKKTAPHLYAGRIPTSPTTQPSDSSTTEAPPPTTTNWEYDGQDEEETTILPHNIFDGQYHEVNPGQYHEVNPGQYHEENPGQYHESNPGQYHEINPGQYEAVVQFNEEEETKSYNVHRKTGDYIIGEVGKIDINNGQTLEGVRYTAVEGMVDQAQIAEILRRYFGAGTRW